jgi:hypothetical protein
MRGSVEFQTFFKIEDREPVVLTVTERSHHGKQYRTTHYSVLGETYGIAEGSWTWRRIGVVLREDGEPRKDAVQSSVLVQADDVPGYALRALTKEIERRAVEAHAEIDRWVQAARDQVTAVEVSA